MTTLQSLSIDIKGQGLNIAATNTDKQYEQQTAK